MECNSQLTVVTTRRDAPVNTVGLVIRVYAGNAASPRLEAETYVSCVGEVDVLNGGADVVDDFTLPMSTNTRQHHRTNRPRLRHQLTYLQVVLVYHPSSKEHQVLSVPVIEDVQPTEHCDPLLKRSLYRLEPLGATLAIH